MKSSGKKVLSVMLVMLLVISVICPSYQSEVVQDSKQNILFGQSLLYLERLCSIANGSGFFEGGTTRHMLQSVRRQNQRILPFGLSWNIEKETGIAYVVNNPCITLVFVMIFMVIICYIFNADGKKRITM